MNYTSIEQSKKLLELGLKAETADACYDVGYGQTKAHIECENFIGYFTNDEFPELKDRYIPCWSLGALLELLREYDDCTKLDIFSNRAQKWQITVSYYDCVWKEHVEININLLESAYSMVVWLLENGYIKTEKK